MKGNIVVLLTVQAIMAIVAGCSRQPGDCVVRGTVSGVRNGAKVVLQNDWDNFKVIGTGRVRDGVFEIHPRISGPAHVYLYTSKGIQLKDFFLEPGTIEVEARAEDESLLFTGATGTPLNDLYHKYLILSEGNQTEAAGVLRDSIAAAVPAGALALRFAQGRLSASRALRVLDALEPALEELPFVAGLRDELDRRVKTEPRESDSEPANLFVDMEYPDASGKPVSLSSVVNDPANRYVLLDFWATWCSPCREALPKLKDAYAKYHGKGFEIYSVSEDVNRERWAKFIAENGMTWINVRDTNGGRQSEMWQTYALTGIPTVVLIDGNTGEIIARDNHLDLDSILSALLP